MGVEWLSATKLCKHECQRHKVEKWSWGGLVMAEIVLVHKVDFPNEMQDTYS